MSIAADSGNPYAGVRASCRMVMGCPQDDLAVRLLRSAKIAAHMQQLTTQPIHDTNQLPNPVRN